jgi:23S rRNA (uracil1939-C5)-methyltransferase
MPWPPANTTSIAIKAYPMHNNTSIICPHFGVCGGCQNQHQPYAEQLAYKQTYIKNLLAQFNPAEFGDIVPSPKIEYFRNKMEFAVAGTVDEPLVGLRPQKKFSEVIDITDCRIFYPQAGKVLEAVREWIKECRIEPYDLKCRTGQLRYISMRHGKAYDEAMVILVMSLTPEQFEQQREMFGSIVKRLSSLGQVVSVYVCLNSGFADEALSGRMELLYGRPYLRERINDIEYQISPLSFFQTNSYCCDRLYQIIRDQAAISGGAVLDLFCGCGGISLQVSRSAARVTGIDIVEQNITDAAQNCRINSVTNTAFTCMDCQQFLEQATVSGTLQEYSTLIVDPPRQGLTKKDRKFILDSGIGSLIYVSCNPWNLVQDFKALCGSYSVQYIQPVDMFPHTPHMEAVVRLARQ